MKKLLTILAVVLCLGGCANMCGECEYTSTQPVEIVEMRRWQDSTFSS